MLRGIVPRSKIAEPTRLRRGAARRGDEFSARGLSVHETYRRRRLEAKPEVRLCRAKRSAGHFHQHLGPEPGGDPLDQCGGGRIDHGHTGGIGTLRALNFRRGAVLAAFMTESLLLAALGDVAGLAAASVMQAVNVSTTNFQTFAELAFRFVLPPQIAVQAMVFALVGGFIPAWRTARLQIVECLSVEHQNGH
jgi:hypothetical protein